MPIGLQQVSQGVFQQGRENVSRTDEIPLEEACVSSRKGVNEIGWNKRTVLQNCSQEIVRDEMSLDNNLTGRFDRSPHDYLSADTFSLRDLLIYGRSVRRIADASALGAMDYLPFVIQMRHSEE